MSGLPPPDFSSLNRDDFEAPQGPSSSGPDFSILADTFRDHSERAESYGEATLWQAAGVAKVVGDGAMHALGLAAKLGGGAAAMASGDSFGQGYDAVTQGLESEFGSGDPGIFELGDYLTGSEIDTGDVAEDLISRRLGKSRVLGDSVGHILSFVTGPGGAIGQGAVKAAKPLTKLSEKLYVTGMKKFADDAGKKLLDQGRVWEYVATRKPWQEAIAKLGHTTVVGGTNTTAAFMAQSYALAPDDERLHSLQAAAMTGWLMAPIAKAGQALGGKVMTLGVSSEGRAAILRAQSALQSGKMSVNAFQKVLRENLPMASRAAGNVLVAPAFESVAFLGIDTNNWELAYKAMVEGDPDAGADLWNMFLGTAAGLAVAKGAVPHDMGPLFKTVRPDLNRLSHYAEAEANKKLKDVQPQEPVEGQDPKAAETKAQAYEKARQEAIAKMDILWAEAPSEGLLKAGWEPSFPTAGKVELKMGNGKVTLHNSTGEVALDASAEVRAAMKEMGHPMREGILLGEDAVAALDNLALASIYRRLQGDLAYSHRGFREAEPGVWVDDNTGTYYRHRLDGRSDTKKDVFGEWKGVEDVDISLIGEGRYNSDTLTALTQLLFQKSTLNPQPLQDAVLHHAITLARNGDGIGAQQIRSYLEQTPFTELMKDMVSDTKLAQKLGTLAIANDNAVNMLAAKAKTAEGGEVRTGEGREGEAGHIDLKDKWEDIKYAGKEGYGGAKRATDYLFEDPAESLSKRVPEDSLGEEVRRVRSRAQDTEATAIELARPLEGRRARGETKKAYAERKKAYAAMKDNRIKHKDVPSFSRSEANLLIDDAYTPEPGKDLTDAQKTVRDAGQAANKFLRDEASDAGQFRQVAGEGGKLVREPIRKNDKSVTQIVEGRDTAEVMGKEELRIPYLDGQAKANDIQIPVRDKDGKLVYEGRGKNRKIKMRRATGEDLNAQWLAEQKESGGGNKKESQSAVEFVRRFKYQPDWFQPDPEGRAYQMRETNPVAAIQYAARRQAARSASTREWGSDIPVKDRAAMLKQAEAEGWEPQFVEALTKPGLTERVKQFESNLLKSKDIRDRDRIMEIATNAVARVQGNQPVQAGGFARFVSPYTRVTSGARSSWAWVLDIPELFTRFPALAGVRRSFASLRALSPRNAREALLFAEREAGLQKNVMDHAWSEVATKSATGVAKKVADVFAWMANKTERLKGAVAAEISRKMADSFAEGKAAESDYLYAQDLIRLSPDQMAELRSGKMSPELRSQFLKESTHFLTSRSKRGYGSEFAENPNVRSMLLFTGFITKRLQSHGRVVTSYFRATRRSGSWRSREALLAASRVAKVLVMSPVAGVMGTALSYFMTDLLSGDPDGFMRFYNELAYSPLPTIAGATGSQFLGGPFGQVVRAANDPDDPSSWAGLTVPGQFLYAGAQFPDAVRKRDFLKLFGNFGIVPWQSQLKPFLTMMGGGSAQLTRDVSTVWRWRREADVLPPTGGSQKYDQAFYNAMSRVPTHIRHANGDEKRAAALAYDDIKTALELAPEDSVAASIRARRLTGGLDNDQREALTEFVNDDETMSRIYQHDAMLTQLAREVGKMEGAKTGAFEITLQQVAEQARLGAGDRWRGAMEEAVEASMASREAGDGFGESLSMFAEAMSSYPQHLQNVFEGKRLRALLRVDDSARRARMIEAVLRRRVADRIRSQRREDARNK